MFYFYCGVIGHNERRCRKKKQDVSNNYVKEDQYGYWMRTEGRFSEGMRYRGSERERGITDHGMQANGSKVSGEKGGDSENRNEEKGRDDREPGGSDGSKEREGPILDSIGLGGSITSIKTGLVGRHSRNRVEGIGEASGIMCMGSGDRVWKEV